MVHTDAKLGDIANLSCSDELAFRIVFEDQVPTQRDLYWRGLVYSEIFYGTWSVAEPLQNSEILDSPNPGLSYEVFLEPTQSRWLYALDTPIKYPSRSDMLGDYRLQHRQPVLSVLGYRLTSVPQFVMDPFLSDDLKVRETSLPATDNPRIRAYASALLEKAGSTEAMIEVMLSEIRASEYRCTLSPPRADRVGRIDEFWFDHKAGFCTHYAGAMVFALRSVGIPARMVGGYQGGEVNPVTGHLVGRQYQAHSWVEVWLPEKGWTRYDPTAAVVPEHIESGLNAALSQQDRDTLSLFSATRMASDGVISDLLDFADSLEYQWNLWVVGYDATTQFSVLKDLLGSITPLRVGIAIVAGGGVSLLLVSIRLFWRRGTKRRHPMEKLIAGFCRRMTKVGYPRGAAETPQGYVLGLSQVIGLKGDALAFRIQDALYNPDLNATQLQLQSIRQDLIKLQFKLAIKGVRVAS
jgi:transglutaminase-like putative cysteine protease